MSKDVKPRKYDNSRRQALVRVTKSAVVDTARDLFVRHGYAATTIEAISNSSGTPLATVYRLFGSKRGILKAVLEVSFVGDDEPVALLDRPSVMAAAAQTDPRKLLEGYAKVSREVLERSGPIQQVLRGAAVVDPEAASLMREISDQRLRGQSRIVQALVERGALIDGMTQREATDIVYTLMSPEVHQVLTVDRGWSKERYEAWLARTLCRTLLRAHRPSRPR